MSPSAPDAPAPCGLPAEEQATNIPAPELAPIDFVSPGQFSVINTESTIPMASIHGIEHLEGRSALTEKLIQLLPSARHAIRIYSPDFEPWLYGRTEVVDICKAFLLAHPRNQLRVLLHDSRRIVSEGHRLMPLLERLSSRTEIRILNQETEIQPGCWLLLDSHSLLLRKTSDRYEGQSISRQALLVQPYAEQFEAMWNNAVPDPNLRRMTL